MPRLLSPPQVETGVGTLYSQDFNDCYFQAAGPIDEINYVFIEGNKLVELWDDCQERGQRTCVIGETGFGTGLNFVVVWWHWKQWCDRNPESLLQLHFVSVEFAPLTPEQLSAVYQGFPQFKSIFKELLNAWPAPWEGCHYRQFSDRVVLSLLFGDGVDMFAEHDFLADCWFLDGFAPSCNHRMWSPELYEQLARHSKDGTRLATFTAAGHVRRGLQAVGFSVEKRPGFNKRHMTVGLFAEHKETLREINAPKIAIIGAGYAGLHLAKSFAQSGLHVDVFDAEKSMSGASGNFAHLLYLKPKLHLNDFNHFFEQAYDFAAYSYKGDEGVHHTGAAHFLNEKEQWTAEEIEAKWPKSWVEKITAQEFEEKVGLKTTQRAIWMPQACFIQPYVWADFIQQKYAQFIHLKHHHKLENLDYQKKWSLVFQTENAHKQTYNEYDLVYITAGAGSAEILQGSGNKCLGPDPSKPSHWRYPLRPIAGQSSVINTEKLSSSSWPFQHIKAGVCGLVYLSPVFDQEQTFGSRFYPDEIAGPLLPEDDIANISDLATDFDCKLDMDVLTKAISGGTSATRVQTTDYLPMVGPVFFEEGEGLHICTGFGAKGSMVAPYVAQILTNQVVAGAPVASNAILKMLHPNRFEKRLRKFQQQRKK